MPVGHRAVARAGLARVPVGRRAVARAGLAEGRACARELHVDQVQRCDWPAPWGGLLPRCGRGLGMCSARESGESEQVRGILIPRTDETGWH